MWNKSHLSLHLSLNHATFLTRFGMFLDVIPDQRENLSNTHASGILKLFILSYNLELAWVSLPV